MVCPNCGLELHPQAVICPRCGYQPAANGAFYQGGYQQYQQPYQRESNGLAIAALICAFLVPLVGLILGIVGLSKFKTPSYRKMCIWAVVLAPIVWVANLIISVTILPAMMQMMLEALSSAV